MRKSVFRFKKGDMINIVVEDQKPFLNMKVIETNDDFIQCQGRYTQYYFPQHLVKEVSYVDTI